jgi:hypothetical protein
MPNNLQEIAATTTEAKNVTAEGIKLHHLLELQSEA